MRLVCSLSARPSRVSQYCARWPQAIAIGFPYRSASGSHFAAESGGDRANSQTCLTIPGPTVTQVIELFRSAQRHQAAAAIECAHMYCRSAETRDDDPWAGRQACERLGRESGRVDVDERTRDDLEARAMLHFGLVHQYLPLGR